jgi:integrase/recombinase XerD
VLKFLERVTGTCKPHTKRGRFSFISAFFNFIQKTIDYKFNNPCDNPLIRKLFRPKCKTHWDIIPKETVDEIIFRTTKKRDRLMLELMARGGMRIGEVLKLKFEDIHGQKLILQQPKSGKTARSRFRNPKTGRSVDELCH